MQERVDGGKTPLKIKISIIVENTNKYNNIILIILAMNVAD